MLDTTDRVRKLSRPAKFPVEVVINGVKVVVTLLLRPGTVVSMKPEPSAR